MIKTNTPNKELPRTTGDGIAEADARRAFRAGKWEDFKSSEADGAHGPQASEVGHEALAGAGLPPIKTVGEAVDAAAGYGNVQDSTVHLAERPPEAGPPVPYPKR